MLMTGERKQTKHKTKDDRTAGEEVLPVVQQIIYYVRILSVGVRKGSLSEWAAEDVLLAKLHLRFPFTTMLHTHRESWIMDSRTRMPNGNPLSLSLYVMLPSMRAGAMHKSRHRKTTAFPCPPLRAWHVLDLTNTDSASTGDQFRSLLQPHVPRRREDHACGSA